ADRLAHLVERRELLRRGADTLAQLLLVVAEDVVLAPQLLDQMPVAEREAAVRDAALHDLRERLEIERFRDVLVRALAQRVDRARRRGVAGHDDDARVRI